MIIQRLQVEFKDDTSDLLIALLKKAKRKIVISGEMCSSLLAFAGQFLTQSEIISFQTYHKRVRAVIGLFSYFIAFNNNLQEVFNNETVLSILHNWIKIEKALDDKSGIIEACRLCIFSIYN